MTRAVRRGPGDRARSWRRLRWPALVILAALGACAGPPETAPAWPGWRGPGGLGISEDAPLPEAWSAESANIRWKSPIPGLGNSSPVVSGQRVFLTTAYGAPDDTATRAERRRHLQFVVIGLDLESGEILWQTPVFAGRRGKKHWLNTFAAPTPVTDGASLFVHFGQWLAALDLEGRLLWKEEVDPGYPAHSRYGAASSPVLAGETVVLFQEKEDGENEVPGWIAGFDKATGNPLWRQEWTTTCCSYVTPIVLRRGASHQVVTVTSRIVAAYDPASGGELWRQDHGVIQPVPSPVAAGDLVLVPGGIHDKVLTMFRLSGSGSETRATVAWESNQAVPEIASPVLYRGLLFTVTESGVLTCRDPETGAVHWRRRLQPGAYHSSLVAGDGKVYVTNSAGETAVVAAEAEFKRLAVNAVGDGGNASPAIAGGHLLIRSQSTLYRIGSEPPTAGSPAG